MAAKINKATNNIVKAIHKIDDFLLQFGTKIL